MRTILTQFLSTDHAELCCIWQAFCTINRDSKNIADIPRFSIDIPRFSIEKLGISVENLEISA